MDDRIILTVQDEGPGIPLSELPHIFDKFYRVRKADHGVAGTGLGLSVARGFVEAFGGSLTAGNRNDRNGAIFILTDPRQQAAECRMNKLPRVLIVDDEAPDPPLSAHQPAAAWL